MRALAHTLYDMFVQEYVPPTSGPRFAVVQLEGKGEGVVATQDIKTGDIILQEQALLKLNRSDVNTEKIQALLDSLTSAQKRLYYRLYNCRTAEVGTDPNSNVPEILGIWKTNAFGISGEEQVVMLGAASRFNRSCKPNSSREWCSESNTWSFSASTCIKAGEEITQTYLDLTMVCSARMLTTLTGWGFLCDCEACVQSPELLEESDKRRSRLRYLLRSTPDPDSFEENQIIEVLDLCTVEGLYGDLDVVFSAYVRGCAEQKFVSDVIPWSGLAAKCLAYRMGETREDDRFLQGCIEEKSSCREEQLAREDTMGEKQ